MSSPPSTPSASLNGWKEIAAYLGKSPRTAQRWERELGLPIQRVSTPEGGAIIFAVRAELDAWRIGTRANHPGEASTDAVECDGDGEALAEGTTPAPVATNDPDSVHLAPTHATPRVGEVAAPWWLRPVPLWAAAIAASLLGAAALVVGIRMPVSGVAATWEFEGQLVRAFTDGGRPLWQHDFGRAVSRPAQFRGGGGYRGDIDGDGVPEVVVPLRYTASAGETTSESDAVVAFSPDGKPLWFVQPSLRLSSATGESFEGPWYAYAIAAGTTAAGPRTWIAFNHNTWWPGFVIEVDPEGQQRVVLLMGGRVHSLTVWRAAGRLLLVAGGALRDPAETRAAAVVVDVNQAAANWPPEGASHLGCVDCPVSSPAAVFVFQTSHLTKDMQRLAGWVRQGKETGSDLLLTIDDVFGPGTIATLDTGLDIKTIQRTDTYWNVHREQELRGVVGHSAEECPDRSVPASIERWSAHAGWTTVVRSM